MQIEINQQTCYNINKDMGVIMTKSKKQHAFTLAEVMIVLLVLTILFAAFAPLITRRQRNSAMKQEVWKWSSRNYMAGPMNTYYRPINNNYLGGIYIGTEPDSDADVYSSFTPVSKLIVRSGYVANNEIQRQLQLRFGRSVYEDPGQLAASFIADNTNLLFGKNFPSLKNKTSDASYPSNNVAFGFETMNSIRDIGDAQVRPHNNTAFGINIFLDAYSGDNNTFLGSGSGKNLLTGNQNTLIGYNAGSKAQVSANTLIGYESQTVLGSFNTFVGAHTGNPVENSEEGPKDYHFNVALGYGALSSITSGTYNVAAGAGALRNLTTGSYNTAIGYNACSGITTQSNITCIGANSGPAKNSPVFTELAIKKDDTTPRTYIGSNPNIDGDNWKSSGKFGGDAVLEIHNSIGTGNSDLINNPSITSNATTIVNGNLIVRGKTFLTMGDALYPFYYSNNIFGTDSDVKCAANQVTYEFSNSGNCATLSPITSDRRLKIIKSKNKDGLAKIKQLKIYNYIFKDDKEKIKHVGVIAQDLQKIFPNSVFKGDNGFLKIRIDEMFYAAINAIKELNTKINDMITQTEKFEKNIDNMEKENKELKSKVEMLSKRVDALKQK